MTIVWVILCALVSVAILTAAAGFIFVPSIGKSGKLYKVDPASERGWFERQFARPLKLGHGLWVYRITPSNELLDGKALPVVFIPGGTPNILSAKELIWQIYSRGREVYFADMPHGSFADGILFMLDHFNVKKASVIAHSAGALTVMELGRMLAATPAEQIFKSVVLVEPSGAMTGDSLRALARRFGASVQDENYLHESRALETWWEEGNVWRRGPQYYFGLSIFRTVIESWKIAHADILPSLRSLRASCGVCVAIVHGEHDLVYPIDAVREKLGQDVDEFVAFPEGRHQDLILRPRRYMSLVYRSLLRMEDKSSARQDS